MPGFPLLRRLLAATALLAVASAAHAVDPDDLLPVDEAFALTVDAPAREHIALHWRIADGYYLYRHRIAVQPTSTGFAPQPLQLPAGERHVDEFFGEVETYRQSLDARLPGRADAGTQTVTLQVKYQGCADLGVCYPPQTRTVTVALPAPDGSTPGTGDNVLSELLGSAATPLFDNSALDDGAPLPPEQAFGFEAIAGDANTVLLRFTPAEGYYLYRDKTTLALVGPLVQAAGLRAGTPQWPPGTRHHDEYFGTTTVYFRQIDVPLPLQRTRGDGGPLRVTATFQGCQTDGICYPPMTRTVDVKLPQAATATMTETTPVASAPAKGVDADVAAAQAVAEMPSAAATTAAAASRDGLVAADAAPAKPLSGEGSTQRQAMNPPIAPTGTANAQGEDQQLAAALTGAGRWWTLLGFLGAGLLLAFTPCVLPMIPILSGLIAGASAGHGGRLGTGRALALSGVYVLASALVFTVAGVVAGLVGANLQIAFQTPWVIVAFAALFVALALSMFGLYELQLPAPLRARLGAVADRQRGGSWPGVAAMGALSALIVGPCVAPPLAAAVLYIGQTRDPVFGGAALFLLAIGMGLPLLAFGVAAGRGLPTSGPWMNTVQRVFGFVFLGLALWMLARILPGAATLALWGLLALAAAAWVLGLARPQAAAQTRWLARFAGLLLAVVGAAQLLGALAGGNDPLRPLAGMFGTRAETLEFRTIKSVADLQREVAAAHASGRPLLFDFYADWCVACKEMEKYTFSDPAVQTALAGFVLLKADVTANDTLDQALMRESGIIGPPATLFFVDGNERRNLRLIGFEDADAFVARVQRATANAPVAEHQ